MQQCPAMLRRAPSSTSQRDQRGVDDFFFSVSPFAVTAAPDVGDVFVAFGPSVELPLEFVIPDCVWFWTPLVELFDESVLVAPLLMAPPLMCELSLDVPLMLEPLLMLPEVLLADAPVLSDAGATAPPTAVVSVVAFLSPLLHAATATRAATIAMCFMKSSVEIMNP